MPMYSYGNTIPLANQTHAIPPMPISVLYADDWLAAVLVLLQAI